MKANGQLFSEQARKRLLGIHRTLRTIRIPFAKQEKAGEKGATYGELSVAAFDNGMVFIIDGQSFNSRTVITDTLDFFESLTRSDIKGRIEEGDRDKWLTMVNAASEGTGETM